MKRRLLVVILLGLLTASCPALAAEVKIVDGMGLLRAVREVQHPVTVVVVVSHSQIPEEPVLLWNTEGLGGEIVGRWSQEGDAGRLVFEEVGQGSWELRSNEPLTIQHVEISK